MNSESVTFGFERDIDKQESGVWVELPEVVDGFQMRVGSTRSHKFKTVRSQFLYDKRGELAALPDGHDRRAKIETDASLFALSEIIFEWKGLPRYVNGERDGDEPFSKETARLLMTDPRYEDVAMAVLVRANDVGKAERKYDEEALGNSQRASDDE